MHRSCIEWGEKVLTRDLCEGARIIEVGAYDVNGSFRPIAEKWKPLCYIGTDIRQGPGVDCVIGVHDLPSTYARIDVVICTEMLEHVLDWKGALEAMWKILRVGGTLILSTRSPGFPKHDYPQDFWRFTPEILESWFLGGVTAIPDSILSPGVLLIAKKVSYTLSTNGKEAYPV